MTPESSEDIAASVLARWLSARDADGRLPPPPADLDPEVVEAVYAMRPDLAPSPSMVLEDVWQTLDEAPRLREWLDGGSGDGIDPRVKEAVYALNPGRAPSAAVTVEEILATVRGAPKLAKFLDDGSGDVDEDIREAIYALRPDKAPPAKVTIEDILGTVEGAPKLARFLDDSGDDHVDTLDPDVLEGIYALRPELAPPPKVRLDDIFARIDAGPLATSSRASSAPPAGRDVPTGFSEATGQEAEIAPANTAMKQDDRVVAREPDVANQPIRRRRGWLAAFLLAGGGASALALAAAVVIVVGVGIGVSTMGGAPGPALPSAMNTESAPPAAAPSATGSPVADAGATDEEARIPEAERREEKASPTPKPAETVASAEGSFDRADDGLVGYGAGPGGGAGQGLGGMPVDGPAPAPKAEPAPQAPSVARADKVAAAKEDAKPATKVEADSGVSTARTTALTRNVPAPDPTREDVETQKTIEYADAEAARDVKFGNYRGAADALAKVVTQPPKVSVGMAQWYAAKSGERYLQAGDASAALDITNKAIGRGKSKQLPAAQRVNGQALEALGRADEAEAVYEAAAH